MSMTFDELKGKILQRGTELIAQGVSTEQLAYLMKGLEVLESIREKDAVADAIAQIGDIQAKYIEAKNLLNQTLQAKAITQLGKPAVRLFGRVMSAWDGELPYCPPTGGNASKFTYANLDWLKENFIKKTATALEFAPRNNFHFQLQLSSWNDNPPRLWSMYLLKNNTDEDKQVGITVQLSSRTNGINGAYVVANGNVLVSYTGNNVNTWNFTGNNAVTIPAGQGLLVFVQNAGYYVNANNNFYFFRVVHDIDFVLPEGVDWDYEAYKELLS